MPIDLVIIGTFAITAGFLVTYYLWPHEETATDWTDGYEQGFWGRKPTPRSGITRNQLHAFIDGHRNGMDDRAAYIVRRNRANRASGE